MVSIKALAAVSHVGKVRESNQDSGYAGHHVFAVADGMGGHAGGDVASAIAMQYVKDIDHEFSRPVDAAAAIADLVAEINTEISATVRDHSELTGMGTTFTSLAMCGDAVSVNHIGDSRLYLLRAGELSQITTDHTFVQRLVDAGRITEDEARVHPRRSVLMRVLGDVESAPEVDTLTLTTREGDRWLLCSDGLSGVVPFDELQDLLSEQGGAKVIADRLIKAALDGGAPDNVTAIVVDIGEPPAPHRAPLVVGSAAEPIQFSSSPNRLSRPLLLAPFRATPVQEAHFEPENSAYLDELIAEDRRRKSRRRITWAVAVAVCLGVLGTVMYSGYQWTQSRYFVGETAGVVTIYRGVQQDIGPIRLSHVIETTDIPVGKLSGYDQTLVEETISADSLAEAKEIVQRLREDVEPGAAP